jgi:hypothetical protein
MKKIYVMTAFLLLLLATPVLAQEKYQSQWYLGVGGNLNVTWIINQNTYGQSELAYTTTIGWIGNLNLGFDYSEHWGFKMEIGYGRMGQKYDDTRAEASVTRDIKLDYVLIPIMAKFRAGGKTVKFYAMVGPQLGILMKAKQSYLVDGQKAPEFDGIDVSKEDIKDRYTKAAAFVRMDLGIEITPGKHFMIDIGLSNAFSITDLNADDWRMPDINNEYQISHNYYAGLNLGFNYKF